MTSQAERRGRPEIVRGVDVAAQRRPVAGESLGARRGVGGGRGRPVRRAQRGARASPRAGWCRCRRRPRRTPGRGTAAQQRGGEFRGTQRRQVAAEQRPRPSPARARRPAAAPCVQRRVEARVRLVGHAPARRERPARRAATGSSVTTITAPTGGLASAAATVSSAMASTSASWSTSASDAAQPGLRAVQPLHRHDHRPPLHVAILTFAGNDVTSASLRYVDTARRRGMQDRPTPVVWTRVVQGVGTVAAGPDRVLDAAGRVPDAAAAVGCSPSCDWRHQEPDSGRAAGDPRVQPRLATPTRSSPRTSSSTAGAGAAIPRKASLFTAAVGGCMHPPGQADPGAAAAQRRRRERPSKRRSRR